MCRQWPSTVTKSAVSSIASSATGNNESIHGVRETMTSLKSSGTLTTILWIPSHVGIRGNEEADRLATRECSSPWGTRIKINLSPSEKISIAKTDWKEKILLNLKNCHKPCIQSRKTTGLVRCSITRIDITACLQRLRSGHNQGPQTLFFSLFLAITLVTQILCLTYYALTWTSTQPYNSR